MQIDWFALCVCEFSFLRRNTDANHEDSPLLGERGTQIEDPKALRPCRVQQHVRTCQVQVRVHKEDPVVSDVT